MLEQFGGKLTKELKSSFSKSNNWKDGKFENISKTGMDIKVSDIPKMIKENFSGRKFRNPSKNIDIIPFNTVIFNQDNELKYIWYGHSVLLLQINGKNILIDPMLGPDASPIGPIRTKRFSSNSLGIIDSLPKIDLVLFTHDHYDHLDLASVKKLKSKVKHFYVALGVKRHLEAWGVSSKYIEEFDWWDEKIFESIKITFTPSRHFSGRGLFDRAKSLWGGWVFETDNKKVYWSGDGGYDSHFKTIGDKFGSFDLGFIKCGQYNEKWKQIHMMPEESVQAAIDSNVNISVPVHWGGFTLALHNWTDPIERFIIEAKVKNIQFQTPRIGEINSLNDNSNVNWWENYI